MNFHTLKFLFGPQDNSVLTSVFVPYMSSWYLRQCRRVGGVSRQGSWCEVPVQTGESARNKLQKRKVTCEGKY